MSWNETTRLLICVAALGLLAGCAGDPRDVLGRSGDAIMLSDNTRLSHDGSSWTAAAPGVTANVIQAHEATAAAFEELAGGTLVFQGVTAWRSQVGDDSITLSSSLQTGTATFDGSGYSIGGLAGGPAFAETDTLTVEGSGGGSVTVDAPPPLADASSFLGEPQGLRTEVRVPDGDFDTLYVFVLADDGSPGDDGLMRFMPPSDMALDGTSRTAPLLDDEAIAAMESRGMTALAIYVAYYNTVESSDFFSGRAVPVQAGRMFQIDPTQL